jgi:aminocarboxymuconate-semialdehyde decarboxylase
VSSLEIVDVHSHLYPRSYIELLKRRRSIPKIAGDGDDERFIIFPDEDHPGGGRPMGREYWDIEAKLAFMDKFDIACTVLSLGNPWMDPLEESQSLVAARALNEEFARVPEETGGKIFGLGVFPSGDLDNALAVAEEVADSPTLVGMVTGPSICGRLFDDDGLEPVWDLLEHRSVPLFVHPSYGVAMDDLAGTDHAFPVGIAFPFETTIAIARLAFAGVLRRHPGLAIIASHGGGTIPFLAGRLDAAWASDASAQKRLPDPPSRSLARLHVDCLLYHQRAMGAAADLVGTDRMAFGSDHPFSVADPAANLRAIDTAFSGVDRENVLARSAIDLFRLKGARAATSYGRM